MNDFFKKDPSLDQVTEKEIRAQMSQQLSGQPKKKHILRKTLMGAGTVIAAPVILAGYVGSKAYKFVKYKKGPEKNERGFLGKAVALTTVIGLSYGVCHIREVVDKIGGAKTYVVEEVKEGYEGIKKSLDNKEKVKQAEEKSKQTEQELQKQKDYNKKELDAKENEKRNIISELEKTTGMKFEYKNQLELATKETENLKFENEQLKKAITTSPSLENRAEGEEESLAPHMREQGQSSNKILGVFVQTRGETLVGIAQKYTGSSSNWRKLAEYNNMSIESTRNGPRVEILMGDLVVIPEEYTTQASLESFEKGKQPKSSFVKKQGETLAQAMVRNNINLNKIIDIMDYNHSLMPAIKTTQQERFWIPENVEVKAPMEHPKRTIKEYPSRYDSRTGKIKG